MAGYIKLHRGWRDCDVLRAPTSFSEPEAWVWLIENAAWKEMTRTGGQGQPVIVPAGHIHVSERSLASAWGWERKRIRRFTARLIAAEMLSPRCPEKGTSSGTEKGTSSGTIYCIVNWEKYQSQSGQEGPATGPVPGQEGDQIDPTQEEGKELKNTHYAFFGRTIRLTSNDLERWRARYHAIADIDAELGSLDDWFQSTDAPTQARWFHVASGALSKKHQAALVVARTPQSTPGDALLDHLAQQRRQEEDWVAGAGSALT